MNKEKKKKEKNPHAGHRLRMKERFKLHGFEGFEEHEILEFLLFYAVPQGNTNETAHRLLEAFGSLSAVMDAPLQSIEQIKGMGEHSAIFLKMIPQACRCYLKDKDNYQSKIMSDDVMGRVLFGHFVGKVDEAVALLLMDSKRKQLFCGIVTEGTVNSVNIYIRKLVALALQYNASLAVLAHNHPSGVALPSKDDLVTTQMVKEALALVGVRLIDHFIITDDDFVSLAQSEISRPLFL